MKNDMKNIKITLFGKEREVPLTEPQEFIVRFLMKGMRATYINEHYMSGGEFVWWREDGDYKKNKCFVGVKAFNGAMNAISKAFNLSPKEKDELYEMFIINS